MAALSGTNFGRDSSGGGGELVAFSFKGGWMAALPVDAKLPSASRMAGQLHFWRQS